MTNRAAGLLVVMGLLYSEAAVADHHADATEKTAPAHTSLTVGGYIQPGLTVVENSEFNEDDANGFEFANARLTGTGTREVGAGMTAGFNFNFDVNRGNFLVRDVYGSFDYADEAAGWGVGFDVGQLKTPFGLALQQSEARMQFPLSSGIRILGFGRDQGFRVRANKDMGKTTLKVWAMMANGERGFRQRRNLDNQFVYTGRTELSLLNEVPLNEPDLKSSEIGVTIGANVGYSPELGSGLGLGDVGASELKVGGDIRVHIRGLSLRAEYLWADRGDNDSGSGFSRFGYYWQVGYVLPYSWKGLQFEPAFRMEQLDVNEDEDGGFDMSTYVIDNTERRRFELGFNTYFAKHAAKLSITYRRTDLLEGPIVDNDGGPIIGDTLFVFAQLAWL